jgi:hypothetical protein
MEPGSELRRYDGSARTEFPYCVVYSNGLFEMRGGALRDNTVSGGSSSGIINLADNPEAVFRYFAGEFSGNSRDTVGVWGSVTARPYTDFFVP